MSPLSGFSDNPFRTRSDLIRAALALIRPLDHYKSSQNARIKIATSTGAGFSETAAQLEGFARPLWVVADLLRLKALDSNTLLDFTDVHLETWITGLEAGTDPESPEYWGDVFSFDQRMVEMESIAYALLSYPQAFSFPDDEKARKNLIAWLTQINHHNIPQSNWLWFRVLVNLALVKSLGVAMSDVKVHIDDSLERLDAFYISDGWSSDGLWCDERRQADYYSGSFAIQFAQLLFVRFAPEYDEKRTSIYKNQASDFAKEYWRYFAPDGAAIPFGRSLTYRFAFAAFWGVAAIAGVDLPCPIEHIGTAKGILLRHLRWWSRQTHIFNTDGTPNIGYAYPNMYLAEDYNSPQSVYWCLKSFLVFGLDQSHPFWSCLELPHPQLSESSEPQLPHVKLIWPPRQILCNTQQHTFLLSSGQYTSKRFKAREAKYGKFAYSSAFGFNVPCGSSLEQIAPDSTLAMSFDDGEESWKVRWDPYSVTSGEMIVGEEIVPTLTSYWKPWRREELTVKTTLIPPVERWHGWSLRVHCIEWKNPGQNAPALELVDGGFAASAQTRDDTTIFERPVGTSSQYATWETEQGRRNDDQGAIVYSKSGASGVVDLTAKPEGKIDATANIQTSTIMIRADPNTNLMAQRSLIPAARRRFIGRVSTGEEPVLFTLVTGIFAIEASASVSTAEVWKKWYDRPRGRIVLSGNGEQVKLSL